MQCHALIDQRHRNTLLIRLSHSSFNVIHRLFNFIQSSDPRRSVVASFRSLIDHTINLASTSLHDVFSRHYANRYTARDADIPVRAHL